MSAMKKMYNVYEVELASYYGGHHTERVVPVGTTYAESKARAISNIRYRLGVRSADLECYGAGGYVRKTGFVASESKLSREQILAIYNS
jgi:hypothetical protein